jgi:hypothetical protein
MNYISMNGNYISLRHNVLSKSSGKTAIVIEPYESAAVNNTQQTMVGSGMKLKDRNPTTRKLNKFINLKI